MRTVSFKDGVAFTVPTAWQIVTLELLLKHWPYEQGELVITSACDGQHSDDSYHYEGKAFDIRTRHLKELEAPAVHRKLQLELGIYYDVILEKTHIHIEPSPSSPFARVRKPY